MTPLVIAHIKGSQSPSTITSSFNPRANEDFRILRIITLATNKTANEPRSLQYYIYCLFNDNAYSTAALNRYYMFSMCWTNSPHTCSIRVAGSIYYSAKPAGPDTRIALFLLYHTVLICNLRSNFAKQFT